MAMTVNQADTLLLLNVANQGVHLWDIRELLTTIRTNSSYYKYLHLLTHDSRKTSGNEQGLSFCNYGPYTWEHLVYAGTSFFC